MSDDQKTPLLAPDERVVRTLENALVAARDGRLRTVAVVAIDNENLVHTLLAGKDQSVLLLGALDVAHHRILTKYVDPAD